MTIRANIGFMFEMFRHEPGSARARRVSHWTQRASCGSGGLVLAIVIVAAIALGSGAARDRQRRCDAAHRLGSFIVLPNVAHALSRTVSLRMMTQPGLPAHGDTQVVCRAQPR